MEIQNQKEIKEMEKNNLSKILEEKYLIDSQVRELFDIGLILVVLFIIDNVFNRILIGYVIVMLSLCNYYAIIMQLLCNYYVIIVQL